VLAVDPIDLPFFSLVKGPSRNVLRLSPRQGTRLFQLGSSPGDSTRRRGMRPHHVALTTINHSAR
jgi:hypothetical protein